MADTVRNLSLCAGVGMLDIGLGIGVPIGGAIGQSMTGVSTAMGNVGTEKASTSSSQMDELERAASLLERGVITEEEFQAMKRRILGGE